MFHALFGLPVHNVFSDLLAAFAGHFGEGHSAGIFQHVAEQNNSNSLEKTEDGSLFIRCVNNPLHNIRFQRRSYSKEESTEKKKQT